MKAGVAVFERMSKILNMAGRKAWTTSVRKCHDRIQTNPRSETWKSVVGLEVHAQISTESKLFSCSKSAFAAMTNGNVSLFDASIPGTLPVLNKKCVQLAALTALALKCKLNTLSHFDRKHYFYSDLPAGYQITQQRSPLASNGVVNFPIFTKGADKFYYRFSKIKQIQLEQDSGQSLYDTNQDVRFIDLNRAGIALMEIVFEPDLSDGDEAAGLVRELVAILRQIESCSCKMEEGALRVDANVSLHKEGTEFGVRTEIKNISSIRSVAAAINYEINRQRRLLEGGGIVVNETRSYDAEKKATIVIRDKEEKQDYRFMPEPNLPPLRLLVDDQVGEFDDKTHLLDARNITVPELPQDIRNYLINKLGLSEARTLSLMNHKELLPIVYDVMEKSPTRNGDKLASLLVLFHSTTLKKLEISLQQSNVTSTFIGELIDLIDSGKINYSTSFEILRHRLAGDVDSPLEIAKERKLLALTDPSKIKEILVRIVDAYPEIVAMYLSKKSEKRKEDQLQKFLKMAAHETNTTVELTLMRNLLTGVLESRRQPI